MSAPSNHWKLGLFVVVGVGLFLALLVALGASSLKKESVEYATYFDESVQGLDVGSPVKFRGVTIGNVSEIDVAPDRRHVEVLCAITVSQLVSLKLLDTTPKGLPPVREKAACDPRGPGGPPHPARVGGNHRREVHLDRLLRYQG